MAFNRQSTEIHRVPQAWHSVFFLSHFRGDSLCTPHTIGKFIAIVVTVARLLNASI